MQALPRIKRESLRDQVANLIRQAINDGRYPPGSKLPTEESLAQQLGVGRSSVREALEHLVAFGLIVRRPGRGVFVAQPQDFLEQTMNSTVLSMPLTPPSMRWLVEVRQVVEPRVAFLAAHRATEQDVEDLAAIAMDLEAHRYEPEAYARIDLLFHRRIAQASGNMLFLRILKPIHSLLAQELRLTVSPPGATDRSLPQHRSIFEAIQARDGEAAERCMIEHLTDVERQLSELNASRRKVQPKPGSHKGQLEPEV